MEVKTERGFTWWLKLILIAVANVIFLAAFAAYFSGQQLDLTSFIGILGDSVGIVTGVFGVWFFFLSEQLNRRTTENLQRTTVTVEDLRNQMWDMLQRAFEVVVAPKDAIESEEAEQATELLRQELARVSEKEAVSTERLETALNTISRRLETLESRKDIVRTSPAYDMTRSSIQLPPLSHETHTRLSKVLLQAFLERDFWVVDDLIALLETNELSLSHFRVPSWSYVIQWLLHNDYLRPVPGQSARPIRRTHVRAGRLLFHTLKTMREQIASDAANTETS